MKRGVIVLLACLAVAVPAGETVTVFAAASLTDAVGELARTYEAQTGVRIVTSFAASPALARQIEYGAPADLFCSADQTWMDHLAGRSLIDPATRWDRLGNALVVVAPAGKGFAFTAAADFPAQRAFTGRMAIGDPSSVPVGGYAKEAFTALGWWGWLEPRLAPAVDSRATLRLVETGEVDCGVVYASDARTSTRVEVIASIPQTLHRPIRYPFAAMPAAGPAARAFLAYLTGPQARPVYAARGFVVADP